VIRGSESDIACRLVLSVYLLILSRVVDCFIDPSRT
jgi:hypothetical protein